jgi:signal transduction histidine kinase
MPGPLRVLIVEDEEDDAVLAQRALARAGFEITAERVETPDALRRSLAASWDVILSDYNMPELDALHALQIVKESGREIPFIIVSGSVGEDTAVASLRAGATDFVSKTKIDRLGPAVERSLEEARVRRERDEAMEGLRAAVRARDEFLSIASHELKTPLTTLQLQTQALLRQLRVGAPLPDMVLRAEMIERNLKRLTAIVNELLDISRITRGSLILNRGRADLVAIAAEVKQRFADLFAQSGTELRTRWPRELVGTWDAERIDILLTNLLANAVKYGAGKPVDMVVDAEGPSARIRVVDRGIGIAPADQQRIFERFERAVPERHYGGFGLGLWLAREIANAHGGSIAVESEPGKGSTFTVLLPRSET